MALLSKIWYIFDWSARVNFETDSINSYDDMIAKELQKGSLYKLINDENGNSLGIRNWEIWNPKKFSPEDWIKAVKLSRAKYFYFHSK